MTNGPAFLIFYYERKDFCGDENPGKSKRNRDGADVLKIADSIADKITDGRTKDNLRDFVKLGRIERLVKDNDFLRAEKTAQSITSLEIKSWALMALGGSQKERGNPERLDKSS